MFNERYVDLMKQYARQHMVSWSINLKANLKKTCYGKQIY